MHPIFGVRAIAAVVISASALMSQSAPAQEAPAAVDPAIYTTVLAHLGLTGPDRIPVVIDSTMPVPADAPLLASLPQELRASFVAANKQRHELPHGAFPQELFRIIQNRALDKLPRTDANAYWSAFREQYPGVRGVVRLSSAGFSSDAARAVVYVAYGCGSLCGSGHLVTLCKDGDTWQIDHAKQLWVS